MKRFFKRVTAIFLTCFVLFQSGCGNGNSEEMKNVPVTLKVLSFLKPGQFQSFYTYFKSEYPTVSLEWEHIDKAHYDAELKRRLEHGDGPDIVFFQEYNTVQSDYLMDLSEQPFLSAYNSSMLNTYSLDNKAYALPGPVTFYAIGYNKDMFKQYGWNKPEDLGEFMELCQKVQEEGILPLTSDVPDSTAYMVYAQSLALCNYLSTQAGMDWNQNFIAGKARIADSWGFVMNSLEQLAEKGIIQKEQANQKTGENLFASEQAAMILVESIQASKIQEANQKFQMGLMPIFGEKESKWLIGGPLYFVGLNKSLNADGNGNKKEAAAAFLNMLSSKEGQEMLLKDNECPASAVTDVNVPLASIFQEVAEILENNRVYRPAEFWKLKVKEAFQKDLQELVNGKMTGEQVLTHVDEVNSAKKEAEKTSPRAGQLEKDLYWSEYAIRTGELPLGNLVADAQRIYGEAEISLVNSGVIQSRLYKGPVTYKDLAAVCPDDIRVVVIKCNGKTIKECLENGVANLPEKDGRFLQVSGLYYTVDMAEKQGNRVSNVTLEDGSLLEDEALYTVAVNDLMAVGKDNYSMINVLEYKHKTANQEVEVVVGKNLYLRLVLMLYFKDHNNVDPKIEGRITVKNRIYDAEDIFQE